MKVFSPVLLLSLGGIVASQSFSSLPSCPSTIIQNLAGSTSCSNFDFGCLCQDSNFVSQASDLINIRCSVLDKIQAYVILNQVCGFAGVTLSVPPPSSTTSSASSASRSSTGAPGALSSSSSRTSSSTSSLSSTSSSSSSSSSPSSSSSSTASSSSTFGTSGAASTASEAASSATASAVSSTHHGGLSTGAKVGIIIGSILGFLLLLGLILCCCLCLRKRRRTHSDRGLSPESVDHEKTTWEGGDGYPHPAESGFVGGAGAGAGGTVNHMNHPAFRSDSLGSGRYPPASAPAYAYERTSQVGNFSRPGVVSPTHRGGYAAAGAGAGAAGAAALASNPARSSHGSHSGLLHNHNHSRGPSQSSQSGMYNSPRGSQYIPENEPPPPRFSQTSRNQSLNSRGTVDYYEDVGQYPH